MIPKIRKRPSGAYSVWDGEDLEQVFATLQVSVNYLVRKYGNTSIEVYAGTEVENIEAEFRFAGYGLWLTYPGLHFLSRPPYRGRWRIQFALGYTVTSTTLADIQGWLIKNGYRLFVAPGDAQNTFCLQTRADSPTAAQ